MAKYLKSPLLKYDVLATAARQPGIYSLGRRASSCSRAQYTYRDDARRPDSSQGVKRMLYVVITDSSPDKVYPSIHYELGLRNEICRYCRLSPIVTKFFFFHLMLHYQHHLRFPASSSFISLQRHLYSTLNSPNNIFITNVVTVVIRITG